MFHPCKVTVVKKDLNKDLCESYLKQPERMIVCNKVELNQEFIISSPYEMPEGICASAWADIRSYIISLASGGEFPFMKNKYSLITTCTDLFRPVYFKIERID